MRKIPIVLRVLIVILVLVYLPQIPGCVVDGLPKSGRIVDKDSGQGLEDVAVIASDEFTICSGLAEYGCHPHNEYRVVVRTDKDGNYQIPSQFHALSSDHYLPWPLFLGSTSNALLITAFKPGYVLAEDADTKPNHFPKSVVENRSGWWAVFIFNIPEMKMQPAQLSLEGFAEYYAQVSMLGTMRNIADDMTPGVEAAIRLPAQAFFMERVCAMPRDAQLNSDQFQLTSRFFDREMTHDIKEHAFVPSDFRRKLYSVEPNGLYVDEIPGNLQYNLKYSGFQAGSVCDVMKEIGSGK